MNLSDLARTLREHPGLTDKRALALVADTVGGDGDDAALVPDGDGFLVMAAEAIWPPFVAANPRAAGIAAVVTTVNDVAAEGGRPLAILDTLVAGDEGLAREVLAGIGAGAALYGVPVVGGHTTVEPGAPPALSAVAVGRAVRPLRGAAARAGDAVCLVACLEGEAVPDAGGGVFFSHLRGPRRGRAAADLGLVADAAEAGEAWSGRDVSMPGLAGSLLQLLEGAGGLGCALDLERVPTPRGLAPHEWLRAFPSYGFLLVGDPESLGRRFGAAGLACAPIGRLDASGRLRLARAGEEALVWDLGEEPLTSLGPAHGVPGGA